MTFVVDGTNGLTFNDATTQSSTATNASNISSGTLGKARLPTGSVLQVVNASYGTQATTASSSYSDTGLTATITPTSATSKILVIVDQNGIYSDGNANQGLDIKLLRGATTLALIGGRAAGDKAVGISMSIALPNPYGTWLVALVVIILIHQQQLQRQLIKHNLILTVMRLLLMYRFMVRFQQSL